MRLTIVLREGGVVIPTRRRSVQDELGAGRETIM